MGWRNHETHSEETKAVRSALRAAGINGTVRHDTGTAWAWLEVNIGAGQQWGEHERGEEIRPCHFYSCRRCQNLKAMERKAQEIIYEVTGRHGQYHGDTAIESQDGWSRRRGCNVPIEHPNWQDVTELSDEELSMALYGPPVADEPEPEPAPQPAVLVRQSPVAVLVMPEQVM